MEGVNVAGTIKLARALSIPVIASGGVSSLGDLAKLKAAADRAEVNLAGAISGRALYDGRLDIAEAITLLKGETDA